MWKLAKKGQKMLFYGWIVQAKPSYSFQKRIGYKIIIKTTMQVEGSKNEFLPIYTSYLDKSKNKRLYEWFIYNHRNPSPLKIQTRKKGQSNYRNTKLRSIESSNEILWIFIYQQSKIELIDKIPEQYNNIQIRI